MKFKPKYLILVVIFTLAFELKAQQEAEGFSISCPAAGFDHPSSFLGPDLSRLREAAATATFEVTYESDFPSGAKTAFQAAVNVWSKVLVSRVPIKIQANWEDIAGSTLANSGAKKVYRNFSTSAVKEVWYPPALADAISGKNVNGTDADITINVNQNINWSYLTNGSKEAFKYDLMTVVLHEIAHGLGFTSSFKINETNAAQGIWGLEGLPLVYDLFLMNPSSVLLTNNAVIGNPSTSLKTYLTNKALYFKISNETVLENLPRLYAPSTFISGGSISHLDETKYERGTDNSLMSPSIASSEINHFPGEVILKVLNQIGWTVNYLSGVVVTANEPPSNSELFFAYPNPSSGIVNLIVPDNYKNQSFDIKLYNSTGVLRNSFKSNSTDLERIDLSGLNSGIYYLNVAGKQTIRLIKE